MIASTDENFRDFGWFLKWDEDFLWKRFHENPNEVSASDSPRYRAWTAEVRIESSYAVRKREREKSRWDLRDSKFLSRTLNFVVEGSEQNK